MGSSSDLPSARHRWNGSTLTLKVRCASRSELPSARHRWNGSIKEQLMPEIEEVRRPLSRKDHNKLWRPKAAKRDSVNSEMFISIMVNKKAYGIFQ